jgi:hypothetical protein
MISEALVQKCESLRLGTGHLTKINRLTKSVRYGQVIPSFATVDKSVQNKWKTIPEINVIRIKVVQAKSVRRAIAISLKNLFLPAGGAPAIGEFYIIMFQKSNYKS